MTHLELLWQSKYNVPDVSSNDIDALVSRIDFIQKRESSMYIPLNFIIRDMKYVSLCELGRIVKRLKVLTFLFVYFY